MRQKPESSHKLFYSRTTQKLLCNLPQSIILQNSKDTRLNCSHYCLYEFPSSREANRISSELGVDKEIYRAATKKPFSFLYIDKPKKPIAKNFTSNLDR